MEPFRSIDAAYLWSYEVLLLWSSGSAFDPDPDLCIGRGATGGMGTILSALSIRVVADRHDPGIKNQIPPIDRSKSWFDVEFVPRVAPHFWRRWEHELLEKAKCSFCRDLSSRGICGEEGCSRKRCGQA